MATEKWSAKHEFPADSCYKNRIVETDHYSSANSGNPTILLETGGVFPQEVQGSGESHS
jgi:hypothetical protein